MSIFTDTNKQVEDFKRLTHDINRWAWVMDINRAQINQHHPQTLKIILDNDQTYLSIETANDDDEGNDDSEWIEFDSSIGSSLGICELLEALRIPCELC
jgi:hypothetical protein